MSFFDEIGKVGNTVWDSIGNALDKIEFSAGVSLTGSKALREKKEQALGIANAQSIAIQAQAEAESRAKIAQYAFFAVAGIVVVLLLIRKGG